MEIIALHEKIPELSHGTVVALGMFDGIHRGHAVVLRRACELAQTGGYASVVWTFRYPPFGTACITDNNERIELFRGLGLDYAVFEDFEPVRGLSPEAFIADILCRQLYCVTAVCGFNFNFGSGGKGTPSILGKLMREQGGEAYVLPAVENGGEVISSTRIRRLLETGEVKNAAMLLGRPYSMKGIIIRGNRIGRTIGVPTINIAFPAGRIIPAYGVYISEVFIRGEMKRGVTNVGINPTIDKLKEPLCETHILDCQGDFYDEYAEIRFLEFRRTEQKFSNLGELRAAIGDDIKAAYAYRN